VPDLKVFLCLFLLFSAGISFAQKQQKENKIQRQILSSATNMPEFPGGVSALKTYLVKSLKYPKKAYNENLEGKVVARIVVEPNGDISNIEIVESLSPECDNETIRVIKKMPDWNPARQNGIPVACYYELPITFRLK